MKKQIDSVQEWCNVTEVDTSNTPRLIPFDRSMLRYKLMKEENEEYLEAVSENNPVEIADALGDMLYILLGTAIEHGMQDYLADVFEEIHQSNMSKMGEDGKPIRREDGKIMKGPNYYKPNLHKILYADNSTKGEYPNPQRETTSEEKGY